MASRYEAQVTIASARNLKNVNWRYGDLLPYAVAWVDPSPKVSTAVDPDGGDDPSWDETLIVPFNSPVEDAVLHIDIVHAGSTGADAKPLVGSAHLHLRDAFDGSVLGGRSTQSLKLKRPSGRPHGHLEIRVIVRQPEYRPRDVYHAPSYGYAVSRDRDYSSPPPPAYFSQFGNQYAASSYRDYPAPPPQPPVFGNQYSPPPQPVGSEYGAAPPPTNGQPAAGAYGHDQSQRKKSGLGEMGMGTGIAVGAAAGLLGGLAIKEGVDYFEDRAADKAAEKVEDDQDYDDGYGRDDY